MANLPFSGRGRIRVFDEDGNLIEERWATNFVTAAGEVLTADRMTDRDDPDGDLSHMAIGEGSGQTRDDTALDNEVARVALDVGYPDQGTGSDANDMLFYATFPASTPVAGANITEAAVFNDSSAGTMFNYYEFDPAIVKLPAQSITIEMWITCGVG